MDSCQDSPQDGLCVDCRLGPGSGWQILINNRRPKDCCKDHSRPVTKDEKTRYSLGGSQQWLRCGICARTNVRGASPIGPNQVVALHTANTAD